MTFLYAARIAKRHGYSSCLLLPDDHLLYTVTNNTIALFASCEEVSQVQCIPYSDLRTINEDRVLATLQKTVYPTRTDEPKKQRRSPKAV